VVLRAGDVVARDGTLPIAGAAEFAESDPREAAPAGAPAADPLPAFDDIPAELRTVLVAEDDELFRRFLAGLLAGRGFEVIEARHGLEALALTLERRPWLILSDVNMPELDGIELCRRVRQHALVRHTPLVFVSGWDDYKERYRGLSAGADEFLSKSTPVRELLIRVQLVLRRYAELGRDDEGRALRGEVGVLGAAGLLQMGHLGRWSGSLLARGRGGRFQARFVRGELVAAETGARSGVDAVYDFLAWTEGRFTFTPGDEGEPAPPLGDSFDALLLEGCRRLDEAARE
jgi:CheY-like chemotaxis protein